MNPLINPPAHGADLATASQRYGIPLAAWLDLSTGINPRGYPVPEIAPEYFQHLPGDDFDVYAAASIYCDTPVKPLAAAGSQVFIQWLPIIKKQLAQRSCRVAVPNIGYAEHAFRWQWAGHEIIYYDPRCPEAIDTLLAQSLIDVLVVMNAHNPLGLLTVPEQLLAWHARLAASDGWLIVDEAFIDATPEYSVAAYADRSGLIVLRSLGKFFGLAGVRCGFAFCAESLREHLRIAIGPWPVSGPTLAIAKRALRDQRWQIDMRRALPELSTANAKFLQQIFPHKKLWMHPLFNSVELLVDAALETEVQLGQRGICVRRIEINPHIGLLRFGLVDTADTARWRRFMQALNFCV